MFSRDNVLGLWFYSEMFYFSATSSKKIAEQMTKLQLYKIIFLTSWWVISAIFITFYEAVIIDFKSVLEGMPYDFVHVLLTAFGFTLIAGLAMASFEILFFNNILRRKSFGITILLKTLFYVSCMIIFISVDILSIISVNLKLPVLDGDVTEYFFTNYVLSGRLLMAILFWGITVSLSLFILQVSDKFGPGVLWEFLKGKYHTPKEEERIFMFMDLKFSTPFGERLGHIQYSQLLQECYYDLTDVVTKYYSRIYQYVGDEVILTWNVKCGTDNFNCLKTYFEYDKILRNKNDYYKKRFDVVPEFKASLHIGLVIAAEVGELKKELAYHGDVLNTAARIQGKCNEFDSKMLISEDMKNVLGISREFDFVPVGNVLLKGKVNPINIFKVEPLNNYSSIS